jgi:superfamily II DNA or RNA helicase
VELSSGQRIAVDRCLASPTFGVFDVPGAGKTAIAINAIGELDRYPALITLPAHLIPQWRDELIAWGVPPEEIAAAPRGCGPAKRLAALTGDCAIALVSYNTWASWNYIPYVTDPRWQSFVFDESHRLRRGKGATSKSVHWLRTKSRTTHGRLRTPIWALSGTPLVRDASDVFPFLQLCDPARFSSRRRFAQDICYTTETPYRLDVGKVRDPAAFRALLGQYSIRRLWHQIPELSQLERRDIQVPVELSTKTLARHRAIKKDWRDPETGEPYLTAGARVHGLRRIIVAEKLEAARELISDMQGPVIVLVWYRDTASTAVNLLSRLSRPVMAITGGTSELDRAKALAMYRTKKDPILIGTIGSLKEGWNLQSGHQIVVVEQHYLSTDNDQAIHRALRRGQQQAVGVWWVWAPKTIDVRVRYLARKRDENISYALDALLEGDYE